MKKFTRFFLPDFFKPMGPVGWQQCLGGFKLFQTLTLTLATFLSTYGEGYCLILILEEGLDEMTRILSELPGKLFGQSYL
jgi:hypothetical protein